MSTDEVDAVRNKIADYRLKLTAAEEKGDDIMIKIYGRHLTTLQELENKLLTAPVSSAAGNLAV